MADDSGKKQAFTCLSNFGGNGLAVGTEDGSVYFYSYSFETKKYQFVRAWSCIETRMARILSIASHDMGKDDTQIAIASKN